MNIGIVLVATNGYFPLGIRFIKKFLKFYKGSAQITFYFFSNICTAEYVPDEVDVEYFFLSNESWVNATNSKFKSILKTRHRNKSDYIFYFDADTNITKNFTEEWFIGDMVGGQHFGDMDWMKETKAFDRNPLSKAYVPLNTPLFQMYFYGAFFGGKFNNVMDFCETLKMYQEEDRKIPYEPSVNDESYINREFHYNPPSKIVYTNDFKFSISDKGGMESLRNPSKDISNMLEDMKKMRHQDFNIVDGKIQKIV